MMKRSLLALACLFGGLCAQAPGGEALCEAAEKALFRHDVAASRELWTQAVKGLPPGEARGRAELQLAVLAWRYDRDPGEASRHFEAAGSSLPASEVTLARARWRREEGDLAGALQLGREALAQAATEEERQALRKAMLHLAPLALQPGPSPLGASGLAFLLEQLPVLAPGQEPVRTEWLERLDLALLAGRGAMALEAWKALIPWGEGGVGQGRVARVETLLSRWQGPGSLSPEETLQLVQDLAGSRLHGEAAWLARSSGLAAPAARDEEAYAAFLEQVKRLTGTYYQQTLRGQGSREAWQADLEEAERHLVSTLDWGGRPAPTLGQTALEQELRRRFGAFILQGRTAGYWDLHYGHVIRDRAWTPQQYGRTLATAGHLITLDFEVSNGCESWLWDGRASHGGWTNADGIFQWASDRVGAQKAWSALRDESARARWQQAQSRLDAQDALRPRTAPMEGLQGVQGRLRHKGSRLLLERLQAGGLEGEPLRKAFLDEWERALEESSILAHEGRHLLDRNLFGGWLRVLFQGTEGLEYRAKLSEVAFAPMPHLAFGGILSDNAGDATPHGKANARLLKGFSVWMEAHAGEIPGLASQRPAWLQLDLLSADQLRQAARSLDPWASR